MRFTLKSVPNGLEGMVFLDWNSRRRIRRAVRETRSLPKQIWFSVASLKILTPSLRGMMYRAGGLKNHRDSSIQSGLHVTGNLLTVGRGTTINHGCLIDCRAEVHIGERCGIAYGVSLITAGHNSDDPKCRAGIETYRSIRIGNGVWLGSNAVVLPGVTIGDGAVIGAGAVVTKNCEPHSYYAGVPAILVRDLPSDDKELKDR